MAEECSNIEKDIDENLRTKMSEKDYRKLKVRLEDIQRRKKGNSRCFWDWVFRFSFLL